MTPMPKIITRICFFRQEIVQYVVSVTQYCLEQIVVSAADQIGYGGSVVRTQATPFAPSKDSL